MAAEVSVNVTGARPSGGSGARDLFSEETTTVLVFKDGSVIQLGAAVAVGQLLFLTKKETNQEVVCQVVHKRSYKPLMCYVELQFTEQKEGFWGVTFPEGEQGERELKAATQVEAEETTEDSERTEVAPHREEDVEELKKEVQALREKLLAMEKLSAVEAAEKAEAAAREAAAKEAAEKEATEAAARGKSAQEAAEREAANAAQVTVSKAKLELASVNDPSPETAKAEEEVKAPLMPTAKDKSESARAVIGMSLPNRKPENQKVAEMAKDTASAMQPPKTALDFSAISASAAHLTEDDPNSIYKVVDPIAERKRILAMSAFLVVLLVGGAWYGKWWQYLPSRKKEAVAIPLPVVEKPSVPRAGVAGEAGKKESRTAGEVQGSKLKVEGRGDQRTATSDQEARKKEVESSGAKAQNSGPIVPDPSTGSGQALKARPPKEVPLSRQDAGATKGGATAKAAAKKNAATSAAAETKAVETVPVDAPVIPAKLLKAASPVYPPDAMLNYITGDVRAEVMVDASGHVGEVKVISGPRALRDAAVEALKQYEYAPATQGGKALSSKVVATVKFWFDP